MRAIRAPPMIVLMDDKTSTESVDKRAPADPYGGVALGVECAWPEHFHVPSDESTERAAFQL